MANGPNVQGEQASPRADMRTHWREQSEAPVRRKKVQPRRGVKRTVIGLTALFAAAAFFHKDLEDLAKSMSHEYEMATIPPNRAPGIMDRASEQQMLTAGKELAAIYDNQLIIKYDPATKQTSRTTLYDDLEKLSGDLGRTADFQRYYESMRLSWLGRAPAEGGIYTANRNPQGTLATYGQGNDFAIVAAVKPLEQTTASFTDILRNTPGYEDKVKNYPQVKAFIDTAAQRQQLLQVSNGQAPGDVAAARTVMDNDPAMKPLLELMPLDANTPSPAFMTLRSVVQALNIRQPGFNLNVDGLSNILFQAKTDRREVCRMATAWRDADSNFRTYSSYAQAVDDVQKLEDAKPAGTGVKVQAVLDRARDVAIKGAKDVQVKYGYGCNATFPIPAPVKP